MCALAEPPLPAAEGDSAAEEGGGVEEAHIDGGGGCHALGEGGEREADDACCVRVGGCRGPVVEDRWCAATLGYRCVKALLRLYSGSIKAL